MKKILVAGGTGLIGSTLVPALTGAGYRVAVLTSSPQSASRDDHYLWNIEEEFIDPEALTEVWAVINLAGEGIVDRPWTPSRKQQLLSSRIDGNLLLIRELKKLPDHPAIYMGSSAIGFYGDRPEELLTETSSAGPTSFLVDLCSRWEASTSGLEGSDTARITIRIGPVLSGEGGILPRLWSTMPLAVGTYFGSGQQGFSWIHIDDLVQMILYLLERGESGVYNGVAPSPITFKALIRAMVRQRKGLRIAIPAPRLAMQLIMGERTTAILQDAAVIPAQIQEEGEFKFSAATIETALEAVRASLT